MSNERLWVHLPKDKADKLREWADLSNLSVSAFLGMCAWIGAKRFMDAFELDLLMGESNEDSGNYTDGGASGDRG